MGAFSIISESGVANGVRRIEAITDKAVFDHFRETEEEVRKAAGLLKTSPEGLSERIERLLKEEKELKNEIARLKAEAAKAASDSAETSEEVLPTHRTFMLFNPAGILHIAVGAYFAGFQVVSDVSKSDIPEDSPEHLLMIRLVDSFSSKQILHNIRIDCFQISELIRHPLDDRSCKHLISGLAVFLFCIVQFLGLNNVRFVSII